MHTHTRSRKERKTKQPREKRRKKMKKKKKKKKKKYTHLPPTTQQRKDVVRWVLQHRNAVRLGRDEIGGGGARKDKRTEKACFPLHKKQK